MTPSLGSALPLRRGLTLAYGSSLVVACALAAASTAGLMLGSDGLYDPGSPLVQVSRGGDAANLILGLPVLLGSMWLAKRGSFIGLLLWPGALFYVLYADALYLVGAHFSALFFCHVAIVTLSPWTLLGIVVSIDAAEARRRMATAPARRCGMALIIIAILAYIGLTGAAVTALGRPANESGMRVQWIVDYAIGTPALFLGGVLLWRRLPLGYVAAPGLLLVSALNGLAFAVSAVLDGLLTGRSMEPAIVTVHLVIGGISFALLAFFEHRTTRRDFVAGPLTSSPTAAA